MKRLVKNQRGDVPITILVIGVFAICVLAILSFSIKQHEVESGFMGVGLVEVVNSAVDRVRFEKNILGGLQEDSWETKEGAISVQVLGSKIVAEFIPYRHQSLFDKWRSEEKVMVRIEYSLPS